MSKVRLLGATLVSVAAALVLTSGAFATNHPGASVSNCSKSGFAVDPSCLLKQKAKNTANVNQTGNAQSGPATVNGGNATGGSVSSNGGSADGGTATAAAPWIVVTKSTAKGGLATNLAPVQGGSSSSTASGGSQNANATGNGGTNSTGYRRHVDGRQRRERKRLRWVIHRRLRSWWSVHRRYRVPNER